MTTWLGSSGSQWVQLSNDATCGRHYEVRYEKDGVNIGPQNIQI